MRRAGSLILRCGGRAPAAGRRRARCRPRRIFRARSREALEASSAHRDPPRRNRGTAAGRMGIDHHRDRTADLGCARGLDPRARRMTKASPSSTPSRRSCIASRSISISAGCSRATTRATAPTTSTAPWTKQQYKAFIAALLAGEKTDFKEWEKSTPYFEGCLPIEVMASRGEETLRFGPMKPVGLRDPRTGKAPLRRRATPAGQCARHAVEHGRLPDQAEAWRTDAHLPHDPGLAERAVRAARRPASQHLHQFAAPARCSNCG